MKFEDLIFKPHQSGMGGIQARHDFENGYGVSIIQTSFSYTDNDGSLCYDTHITSDVLGHQSKEDINLVLRQVEVL